MPISCRLVLHPFCQAQDVEKDAEISLGLFVVESYQNPSKWHAIFSLTSVLHKAANLISHDLHSKIKPGSSAMVAFFMRTNWVRMKHRELFLL